MVICERIIRTNLRKNKETTRRTSSTTCRMFAWTGLASRRTIRDVGSSAQPRGKIELKYLVMR